MSSGPAEQMSGVRKAAVLAALLGPEKTADLLSRSGVDRERIEAVAAEVAMLSRVDEQARKAVRSEFVRLAKAQGAGLAGRRAAAEILARTLGPEAADEVLRRLNARRPSPPFSSLAGLSPAQIVHALRGEQPRAIAVVLRHLPRALAGAVLSALAGDVRDDVVMCLARGDGPLHDALTEMEKALQRRVIGPTDEAGSGAELAAAPGPRTLVEILSHADLSVENMVLEGLAQRDPELGEKVRESMFIFDDLPRLDPRALQLALREVDAADLALALKGAREEVRQAVFANLSENAAAGLREDLEGLGPVRRRDVYAAQQKIVLAVRALADAGKINIRQQGEEAEEIIT